jgi:hypothetical protein
VIIDGSINKTIDKDAREVMEDFFESSQNREIDVELIKIELKS